MERLILIKYGELTTKKENRKMFIKLLANNIKSLLSDYNFNMVYDRVRMYITCDDKDIDVIASKLSKIFGIHSVVICHKTNNDTNEIKDKISEILKKETFKTFKVETKRADKRFPMTSTEFGAYVGEYMLNKSKDLSVNLFNYDFDVNIDIRENNYTYIQLLDIIWNNQE